MIHKYFKSLSLEMLLEMLVVSDSQLILNRNNKVAAENIDVIQKVILSLEKAITAKQAESSPF